MSSEAPQVKLHEEALAQLDEIAASGEKTCWFLRDQLLVNDPDLARSLLSNEDDAIIVHSDFFGDRARAVAPRSAQVEISRACFRLIQAHARNVDIRNVVAAIGAETIWPLTANQMLLDIMRPILARPGRSPAFHRALNDLVSDRIVGRYTRQKRGIRRLFGRFRYANSILREAENSVCIDNPDILDLIGAPERRISPDSIIQLYTGFVFSLVSSIGLTLAWTMFLSVRHGAQDQPARNLVLESMRLNPVAWLLERQIDSPTTVDGTELRPPQKLVISPYTVHRSTVCWPQPAEFLPERWNGDVDRRAWIPFGVGAQSCLAASFSLKLLTDLVDALFRQSASIELTGQVAASAAALAPPEFVLRRSLSTIGLR